MDYDQFVTYAQNDAATISWTHKGGATYYYEIMNKEHFYYKLE
ncbi:MAG TPA: hypothetical protein VL978_10880 [Puia sp.]|nr:hypothetical protein [Puia sp.]